MIENEQIELKPRAKTGGTPAPEVLSPDDTGSQALSEALQSSFFIVKILMVLLVGAFLCSGLFNVQSGQQAIILRFGKPVGEGQEVLLQPGFHWAFPPPIDEVQKVSIGQVQTATSTTAWHITTPEIEAGIDKSPPPASLDPARDGYAITRDANIIHVRATLRYTITEPIHYLFDYTNAAVFVTNALNNAILFATTHYTVDEALYGKQTAFRETVSARLQALITKQNLGILISKVDVKTIPPRQTAADFNLATSASQGSNGDLNKAEADANKRLSKAREDYQSRTNAAGVDSARYVSQLEGEAKQFSLLLPQFNSNPELFIRNRQMNVLARVYGRATNSYLLSKLPNGTSELRLLLNREPEAK